MRKVCSTAQIRAAEDEFFATHLGIDLMQLAAEKVSVVAQEMLPEKPICSVLIAVGPGNNGGDGLYAGRNLANRGVRVWLWLTSDRAHEAGLEAARQCGCTVVDAAQALALLPEVDLVIDAVLGIGGRPGLPSAVKIFADAVCDVGMAVLAVDLPSGLDADSPLVGDSFSARTTITFGAAKLCQVGQPAAGRCGEVEVADLGLDCPSAVHQLTVDDLVATWPYPSASDDKYSRGVVGIDTGSDRYLGAAVLSCLGAVYSGAGLVRFVGADRATDLVLSRAPSVTCGSGRANVWLLGSGWGDSDANSARFEKARSVGVPLVLDADALRLLPADLPDGSLLTPHAGELAQLLGVSRGDVEADPTANAELAARRFGATVLLKGATNYCVSPSGEVVIAIGGPAWTAQAGSGDVLAGICATLLASGVDALLAGACAASAQALTAQKLAGPFPPDRVAETLPVLLGEWQALNVGCVG